MKALHRLANDAYLAGQNCAIKAAVKNVCDKSGLTYEQIKRPETDLAQTSRRCLVCALWNLGLSKTHISKLANLHFDEVSLILLQRRVHEQPVRTTNYGVSA